MQTVIIYVENDLCSGFKPIFRMNIKARVVITNNCDYNIYIEMIIKLMNVS